MQKEIPSPAVIFNYCTSALGERLDTLMEERFDDSIIVSVTEVRPQEDASQDGFYFSVSIQHEDNYFGFVFGPQGRCIRVNFYFEGEQQKERHVAYLNSTFAPCDTGSWQATVAGTDTIVVKCKPDGHSTDEYVLEFSRRPAQSSPDHTH